MKRLAYLLVLPLLFGLVGLVPAQDRSDGFLVIAEPDRWWAPNYLCVPADTDPRYVDWARGHPYALDMLPVGYDQVEVPAAWLLKTPEQVKDQR